MTQTRWAVAGAVAGALIGSLVFAPASWLGVLLEHASGGQVQLLEPSGTVWRGQGRLRLSGGSGSADGRLLPGRLRWQLQPGWLVLRLELQADCCTDAPLQASLRAQWRGMRLDVDAGESRLPADLLVGLGAPWNTLRPDGELRLGARGLSLEWSAGRVQARGVATLDALGMSCALSTLRPIGSYRLQLQGAGGSGPPQLILQTLDGSLRMAGSGQWSGSRWNFRGQASADAAHEQVLGNLLNIVGRRQGAQSEIALD